MVGYLKFLFCRDKWDNKWFGPYGPGHYIDHGASMVVFKGHLWAFWVDTADKWLGRIYVNRFVDGNRNPDPWLDTSKDWRAYDRISVTTMNDLLYIAYRGFNQRIYLGITDDPGNPNAWRSAGPITGRGQQSWFHDAPAIAAFEGELHMLCRVYSTIYHTRLSPEGKQLAPWVSLDLRAVETAYAPALCVFEKELYFVHVGWGGKAVYTSKLSHKDASWQLMLSSFPWDRASSAPSLTVGDYEMFLTFKARNNKVIWAKLLPGDTTFSAIRPVPGAYTLKSSGIASFNGLLFVSIAITKPNFDGATTDIESESDDENLEKKVAQVDWDRGRIAAEGSSSRGRRWYDRLLCA